MPAQPSRKVAVVVPLPARPELSPDEQISMRQLCHVLGAYDKFLVGPEGSAAYGERFTLVRFPRKFFGSGAAHNQLLMWPGFYRTFADYEFILIYHLDSLVLSDELLRWCDAGVDYIGAPWLPCSDTPWVRTAAVGNGGFTLMRVQSALQVLENRHRQRPLTFVSDMIARNVRQLRPIYATLEAAQRIKPRSRLVERALAHRRVISDPALHAANNDYFWSFRARHHMPTFKVASVDDGLKFAFEAAPRTCFELNRRQLPFGCHAWTKFDRAFWEPHLVEQPVQVASQTR